MAKIQVLSQDTINQIAAGEVVERPSSVVKELTENALDAGATAITAEIKNGGLDFIRITDNGSGIVAADVPLAFLQHATSKIRSAEDLLVVGSLGFRGEALSSIAAVARVELMTKTRDALSGRRYCIEGGVELTNEEIGCPDGTTFVVRELFYNTPARRKFLKTAATEAGYISDYFERMACAHPSVSFQLINNQKTVLHTAGNGSLQDVIYRIFGRELSKQMVPVRFSVTRPEGTFTVEGFAGKPTVARANRSYELYFINGRYIKSPLIGKAIEEAYKPYTMQHKYPFTVLCYQMPPSSLDVNVHPTKMELRFSEPDTIYRLTYHALREALSAQSLIVLAEDTAAEPQHPSEPAVRPAQPFETVRRGAEQRKQTAPVQDEQALARLVSASQQLYQATRNGDARGLDSTYAVREAAGERLAALPELPEEALRPEEAALFATANAPKNVESGVEQSRTDKENAINNPEQTVSEGKATQPTSENEPRRQNVSEGMSQQPTSENEPRGQNVSDDMSQQPASENAPKGQAISDGMAQSSANGNESRAQTGIDPAARAESTIVDYGVQLSVFGTDSFLSEQAVKRHRIVGQLFRTYWLVELDDTLYYIDQHAAHEKVLYEETLARLATREVCAQQLSPPLILSLSLREAQVLREYEAQLTTLGFEFEPFGGKEYAVRALPVSWYGVDGQVLLIELIDSLAEDTPQGTPQVVLEKIASLSCKAAVKGNHTMSEAEARALIDRLMTLENPYHCPHGRPVIVALTKRELEKRFRRVL